MKEKIEHLGILTFPFSRLHVVWTAKIARGSWLFEGAVAAFPYTFLPSPPSKKKNIAISSFKSVFEKIVDVHLQLVCWVTLNFLSISFQQTLWIPTIPRNHLSVYSEQCSVQYFKILDRPSLEISDWFMCAIVIRTFLIRLLSHVINSTVMASFTDFKLIPFQYSHLSTSQPYSPYHSRPWVM